MSKVAAHPWGRTAEWPLVPRIPHSLVGNLGTAP